MIRVRAGNVPGLLPLLSQHPRVAEVVEGASAAIEWAEATWHRSVWQDNRRCDPRGLVEIMDNNPMICADEVSVPGPAATLALIAAGPLIRGSMLLEPPAVVVNFDPHGEDVEGWLSDWGWSEGCCLDTHEKDLGNVLAARVVAVIQTPSDPGDIDSLYEEAFGRSFFVRRDQDSEWHVRLVENQAHAAFRLSLNPEEGKSLLTVQVMADRNGKCGAAQLVHAMNVMAGFEESLGLG